jgi:DNA-binding SARP family transcriptional activator/predicted ATPase
MTAVDTPCYGLPHPRKDRMARLNLTLLGGFQGRLGAGVALTLPTRKAQALLAYLALPPGRSHPREKLASLLWGGVREPQARRGLRQALFTLRKAVATGPPALLIAGETVALNSSSVDVDAVEFERWVAEGTPASLERATSLYRGDLLQGLALQEAPFEEWLLAERERLRELALEALAKLLVHQRTAGATESALRTALRLIALDPLQEPVHRALMRLYAQLGRRAAALRQYQVCVGALQRELGVEPEATTKQLYQEILRQRPTPATINVESPAGAPTAALEVPRSLDETLSRDLPLIGREPEMHRLREIVDRGLAGHGQVVAVIGEAGIGKSRLIAEVAVEVSARGGRVLIGRCYEAEQVLPFGPWVDALRAGQLDARDEVLESLNPFQRTELARLLPELGRPGHEPGPGPGDHRQLFESVAQLVRLLALQQPLMLILEDLHWADEMSLRLLSFLGRRLHPWSTLVVGTAREEDLARAPVLRRTLEDLVRDQRLVEMRLGALSKPDTLALVRTLARAETDEAVVTSLAEQVWIASEGNPFVVVETVRSLPEGAPRSPAKLAVPQRVRETIVRHLEQLSENGRELAAVAAVIGREFDFPLLQRSAGFDESEAAARVEELVRCRVLHNVGERFDFTHDRIREAAYGSLLPERRRVLHVRIAQAMETLYGERLVEHVERLAHHAMRGELREKAVGYLRQAGANAFARCADTEALAYFTQALGLLETLAPGAERDREELAVRLAMSPPLMVRGWGTAELKQNSERARSLAAKVGEPIHQFQALWAKWSSVRDNPSTALEVGRELLGLAERTGDRGLLLEGHHALWPVLLMLGEPTATRHHLEQGMALYDRAQHRSHAFVYGGHDPGTCCRRYASWTFWILGYPARALEESLGALRLAEELAHAESIMQAHAWACFFRDLRREVDALQEHSRALITVGIEQGIPRWRSWAAIFGGWVRAERGEGAAAIAQIRDWLEADGSGARHLEPYLRSILARACLKAEQPDEGLRVIDKALAGARTTGEVVWEPELHRLKGELRLATSPTDVAGALECFRQAIDIARRQQARSWELRAASSLARLLAAEGRRDEARGALADIYGWFTEGFDTADLREAKALLEAVA